MFVGDEGRPGIGLEAGKAAEEVVVTQEGSGGGEIPGHQGKQQ